MNILSEIVVNEVSKSIYGVPIINSVSMTLVSGNVYGFQGINGSGKTMLMRLICGLIYPTKGEIVIDGKRLGKEITFPQRVGLLLENPAFLDSYTGFENLEMLASIKNIPLHLDIIRWLFEMPIASAKLFCLIFSCLRLLAILFPISTLLHSILASP